MPGKIFISYRRDDERQTAARLRDKLAAAFGEAHVFMDVDNLRPGQRFDAVLASALEQTDVLLAIIGPRWMPLLAERAEKSDVDFVRFEIGQALARRITVVPVLVEEAKLPRLVDLPDDLKAMVLHQKHDLSYERFGRDADALVEAIDTEREERRLAALSARSGPSQPERSAGRAAAPIIRPDRQDARASRTGQLNAVYMIGTLAMAIGLGGALAYAYKSLNASPHPAAVRADPAPKAFVDRVEDNKPQPAGGEPRKVPTVIVNRDGTISLQPLSDAKGHVPVVTTRKTQEEALKSISELQQKYPEVLGGRSIETRQVDLGAKGVWYRVIVSPPGSLEAARELCKQLKDRGSGACFTTAY